MLLQGLPPIGFQLYDNQPATVVRNDLNESIVKTFTNEGDSLL